MRRFARTLIGVPAIGVLALGLLTACSPAPVPIVAVEVRDGQPAVLLVTCPGKFSQLSVYLDEETPSTPSAHDTLYTWSVHGDAATDIVEVTVFGEPPAGWVTEGAHVVGDPTSPSAFAVEPIDTLAEGRRYAAGGTWSTHQAFSVDFTAADLARLPPGEVMTTDEDGAARTMAHDDFVAHARDQVPKCS